MAARIGTEVFAELARLDDDELRSAVGYFSPADRDGILFDAGLLERWRAIKVRDAIDYAKKALGK